MFYYDAVYDDFASAAVHPGSCSHCSDAAVADDAGDTFAAAVAWLSVPCADGGGVGAWPS